MERPLANVSKNGRLKWSIKFGLLFHLVCKMFRVKRFWLTFKKIVKLDCEPTYIQLDRKGSKLNQFGMLSLKFNFGNN